MSHALTPDVLGAAAAFALPGRVESDAPIGAGHINDSFKLTLPTPDGPQAFVLQRLNARVFPNPLALMDNAARISAHLRTRRCTAGPAADAGTALQSLGFIPTRAGPLMHRDDAGGVWRAYRFIDGIVAQAVRTPQRAELAARAFGAFQRLLADLPPPRLHETIPAFHDTPARLAALERAAAADIAGRSAAGRDELDFIRARRDLAAALLDLHARGAIPERVVHNDAKLSNLVLDAAGERVLAVIDLDTVMPGLSLFDFGDMVRSMSCSAAEDEPDLARVAVDPALFEALARGYLAEMGGLLTPAERANLVTAGRLIALEQGVRFLTDFLCGDAYYRTTRPGHNLDRCRTQLALVASLERQQRELERLCQGGCR